MKAPTITSKICSAFSDAESHTDDDQACTKPQQPYEWFRTDLCCNRLRRHFLNGWQDFYACLHIIA